jgi:hypothetical protein
MYSTTLSPSPASAVLVHTLSPNSTKAYLHVLMRSGYRFPKQNAADAYENGRGGRVQLGGHLVLEEGDGAFIEVFGSDGDGKGGTREVSLQNIGGCDVEMVFVEM